MRSFIWLSSLCLVVMSLFVAGARAECPDLDKRSAEARLRKLQAEVRYHDRLYYREQRPVISDLEYDRLFAELVRYEACFPELAADDSPTRSVGYPPEREADGVTHLRPMLSLASAAGPEAIEALLKRLEAEPEPPALLVQPKVDGLPVELSYLDGRLVSAATRGDGQVGEEVTARVRHLQGVPRTLPGRFPGLVTVRGEIYADRQFLAASGNPEGTPYATLRHLAAATLRKQDPDPLALASLRLFPFAWVDAAGVDSDWEALQKLATWGFPVRAEFFQVAKNLEEVRALYRRYLATREDLPFASDGIVVKLDDLALRQRLGAGTRAPRWAAAWKFPPATASSEILAIHWNVGRTGRRTPVAEIAPVELEGVTVSRIPLHNAEKIARLGLVVGDRVVVALAGDAVPQLLDVVGKEPRLADEDNLFEVKEFPPAACLSDGPACREQFVARLAHFVSRDGLDISGLGAGRAGLLVEAGLVQNLPDLFRLQADQVAGVPGFGERSALQLTEAIYAARPAFPRLLTALSIPGVGPAAARQLSEHYSGLSALAGAGEEQLAAVAGIPTSTANNIQVFFQSAGGRQLLADLEGLGLAGAPSKAEGDGSAVPARGRGGE